MKRSDVIRLLSISAWLGIGLIVLIVATTRVISIIDVAREIPMGLPSGAAPSQFVPPSEPLGELGSHCGGPLRLPCRPGLVCSVDHGQSDVLGLCIQPQGVPETVRQLGEACDLSVPCAPGLVCSPVEGRNVCATENARSPKISSFTIAGAQFAAGVYSAPAGSDISVHASVTNAQTVMLRSHADGDAPKDLGALTSGPDGYPGRFTVPPGFAGSIEIVANATDTGFTVQSVRFQASR